MKLWNFFFSSLCSHVCTHKLYYFVQQNIPNCENCQNLFPSTATKISSQHILTLRLPKKDRQFWCHMVISDIFVLHKQVKSLLLWHPALDQLAIAVSFLSLYFFLFSLTSSRCVFLTVLFCIVFFICKTSELIPLMTLRLWTASYSFSEKNHPLQILTKNQDHSKNFPVLVLLTTQFFILDLNCFLSALEFGSLGKEFYIFLKWHMYLQSYISED